VVSRRAHQTEHRIGAVECGHHHAVDGGNHPAGGEQRDLVGTGRDPGVSIKPAGTGARCGFDQTDELFVVSQRDLLGASVTRVEAHQLIGPGHRKQNITDAIDFVAIIGMIAVGVLLIMGVEKHTSQGRLALVIAERRAAELSRWYLGAHPASPSQVALSSV